MGEFAGNATTADGEKAVGYSEDYNFGPNAPRTTPRERPEKQKEKRKKRNKLKSKRGY